MATSAGPAEASATASASEGSVSSSTNASLSEPASIQPTLMTPVSGQQPPTVPWTLCSTVLKEEEYQITMRHITGASVGIGMTDPVGGKGAVVKGDLQPNGQVAAWNKTCQESERVKEGDILVGVGTKPDALTSVAGRSYKEVIQQVRTQIQEWEKDGALILRFKRPPPRPVEEPHSVEKSTEPATDKKDPEAKEGGLLGSAKKIPPLLHTKRTGGTGTEKEDAMWVDAAAKLNSAGHFIEQATNAASAKLKKDWEGTKKHLKKDERGAIITRPEPVVRDPDAEIYLTEGQEKYLEVLSIITSNSAKLTKLLQFVNKTQKQDVLFVCEVEQLLAAQSELNALAIASQTKKIMRVFLELGNDNEPAPDQPATSAEETAVPCTVMQRLRPKVANRLRELHAQLLVDTEMDEVKPKELIEVLEMAKEDTRRGLCRDVLGNFADYLSGKTYNKDVESAEAFPFDFDDILTDPRLYRAFLLFLMDAQRYQMLLFWKACYDVNLDTFVQSETKDPVILCTLQELYRKYIRGVSAPPSLLCYFPATFREQNIVNDAALPGALQSTCKKIENMLRVDIWSMFLASPHYITLMGTQKGKGKSKVMNGRNLMAFLKQQPVTQEMIVVPCKKVPLADPYMVAVTHKPQKSAPPTPTTSPPPSPPPSPKQSQTLSPASTTSTSVSPRPSPAAQPAPPAQPPVVELRPHRIFEYVIVLSAFDRAEHSSRLCNVKLLRRHPRGDHTDFPMPNAKHIAQLCFPFNEDVAGACNCPANPHFDSVATSGVDAWGCPSSGAPRPVPHKRLFTFIMNDSSTGNKLYGAYLLIKAPPGELKEGEERAEGHRASNSLVAACVMSRIPLVQVLRDALWSLSSHTSYADWLTHPYELSLVPFLRMSSASLLKGEGPRTVCSDVPLKILLRHLHPNRVMLLLAALLLEKQILVASSDIAILGLVCECAISELLLPFTWNYLTIPILPFSMLHYLDCPTPFLMGIHTCYLPLARAKAVGKDTVIVNLDEDEITAVSELPRLPAVCATRLSKTLKSLYFDDGLGLTGPTVPPAVDADLEFHRDLTAMWAFMLAGWKDFCLYLPDQQDPSIIFDCPNFLNSRMQLLSATDSCFALPRMNSKLVDELVDFLGVFVRSGFFPLFIQQRTAFITHANDAKSGDFDDMEKFLKDGLDGVATSLPVPNYTRPSFKTLQEALILDPSPSFFEDDNDKAAKQSSLDAEEDLAAVKRSSTVPSATTATTRHVSDTTTHTTHSTTEPPAALHVTTHHTSTNLEKSKEKEKSKLRSLFEKKKLAPSNNSGTTLPPEKLAALASLSQTVHLASSTSSAKQRLKKTFGSLPASWSHHHGGRRSSRDKDGTSAENSRTSSRTSNRSRGSRDHVDESLRHAELGLDTATAAYANRVVEASLSKNSEDSEHSRNPYEDSINASTWGSQASVNTRLAFSPELFIDPNPPEQNHLSSNGDNEEKSEQEGFVSGRSEVNSPGGSSESSDTNAGDTDALQISLNSREASAAPMTPLDLPSFRDLSNPQCSPSSEDLQGDSSNTNQVPSAEAVSESQVQSSSQNDQSSEDTPDLVVHVNPTERNA